jgi:hypothetical protein
MEPITQSKGNNNYRSVCHADRKYADAERTVHSLFANSERKRRRKERTLFIYGVNPMSIATYRGVKYDTEQHQKDFISWWNAIHCNASRWLTYRGKKYRTVGECKL